MFTDSAQLIGFLGIIFIVGSYVGYITANFVNDAQSSISRKNRWMK